MITPEIQHLLSVYGYWLMAFGAIIEGETFLIAGGIAAQQGLFHLEGLVLLAVLGSTLHDSFFFLLGRYGGEAFIRKKPQLYEKATRILDLFEKYGIWLILGLRFAYGLRTVIPTVLGMSHLSFRKFIFYDLIGGFIWSCTFIMGGYFFGSVLDQFVARFEDYSAGLFYGIGAASLFLLTITCWYWRRIKKKKRAALKAQIHFDAP